MLVSQHVYMSYMHPFMLVHVSLNAHCTFCVLLPTYILCLSDLCILPGPSYFLAGNRLHVPGQRADLETTAVIPGTTSRAFSAPTSNTH